MPSGELDDTARRHMLNEFRAEQASSDLSPFHPSNLTGEAERMLVLITEQAIKEGN